MLPPPSWDMKGLSDALVPQYAENAWVPRSYSPERPHTAPSFLAMWIKVAWPALIWGVGTAVGELPPYFIARAARRSGQALGELEEARKLSQEKILSAYVKKGGEKKSGSFFSPVRGLNDETSAPLIAEVGLGRSKLGSFLERCKVRVFLGVQKYGFWAILVAASIPNPLFDLAGMTCGHVGISFLRFFSATLLGKALFKAAILQAGGLVAMVRYGPLLLGYLDRLLPPNLMHSLRRALPCHNSLGACSRDSGSNWVGMIWGWILLAMVGWLILSIVESVAQEQILRVGVLQGQRSPSPIHPANIKGTLASVLVNRRELKRSSSQRQKNQHGEELFKEVELKVKVGGKRGVSKKRTKK